MNFKGMNLGLSSLGMVAALTLTATSAFAQSESAASLPALPKSLSAFEAASYRLIETVPGKAEWMSPQALGEMSRKSHANGHCGGFVDITDGGKVGFAELSRVLNLENAELDPAHQDVVNPLLPEIRSQNILETITTLSTKFPTRHYQTDHAVAASAWIVEQMKAYAKGRTDITVESVAPPANRRIALARWKMPSVRARIAGNGPNKEEIVIVGGHIDSTSNRASTDAPGADDDASGTASFLEAYRVLAESGFKPNRTIEFIGYSGEEAGLLGSQQIANDYKAKGKKIAGVLQLDMTAYPGSGTNVITLITDYVDAPLTKFTAKLVDTYIKMPWQNSKCGYGCSDHASWTKAGYPAVFPFESAFNKYNSKIHTPNDKVALLDADFAAHFSKLALAFAVELGLN